MRPPHLLQVRGSIPLLWTQLPNIKYKPPTKISLDHNSAGAFDKHMLELLEAYKAVIAINLVGGDCKHTPQSHRPRAMLCTNAMYKCYVHMLCTQGPQPSMWWD